MIESEFIEKKQVMSDRVITYIQNTLQLEQKIIKDQLCSIMEVVRDDVICFIEYPYVEKTYRDSYYSFFSKKHNTYIRDSIRICFFTDKLNPENYFDAEKTNKYFLGYICLRPTTHRIIGSSFLNPLVLKQHNFVCCLCKKVVLVNGLKLNITGFPYCGQDNESITCSEISILNIMDYFGHKYPEYSTILPSQVNRILSKHTFERQLPSRGQSSENISYVLKKIGFGTRIYSFDENQVKDDHQYKQSDFRDALYMYIESGIPIILTMSSKHSHHAVLAIGREDIVSNKVFPKAKKCALFKSTPLKAEFSALFDQLLIMNDNRPPYETINFEKPIKGSAHDEQYELRSFIVPLYPKVHLDAYQFKRFFHEIISSLGAAKNPTNKVLFTDSKKDYIYRYFLTSSRSYKNYIAEAKSISPDFKAITLNKSMPKFVWIGEIIEGTSVNTEQVVKSIIVLDATETGLTGHLIFATNTEFLIIKDSANKHVQRTDNENNYKIIQFDNEKFYTFANNLKGEHTRWQS